MSSLISGQVDVNQIRPTVFHASSNTLKISDDERLEKQLQNTLAIGQEWIVGKFSDIGLEFPNGRISLVQRMDHNLKM